MVAQGPGNPAKLDVGKKPTAVLVTLVLRQGSLTEGNLKTFEFRPTDVLIVTSGSVDGVELSNKFVSVDRRQGVPNRTKVTTINLSFIPSVRLW